MENAKIEPELDKIDPENLVELYGIFGLHGKEHTSSVKMGELQKDYSGDLSSAVHYLWSENLMQIDLERGRARLDSSEKVLARDISDQIYLGGKDAEELLEDKDIPEYLANPDTREDFNEPEKLDQDPSDELYTRIIEVLSGGKELKPEEIEDKLAVEINFDLEPKLAYMETQNAAEKVEDGRYRLRPDSIDDIFLGERLNKEGAMVEKERYGNDPWKP